ncbi:protein-L-isoaspartate O-methyltransferase domain-containing protein 1 isoform X5 [Pseudorca crassidens]|uniref:protein-L-isoaspartate O-methyltransferase domain-containing protein 1 isoform X5 n=1 Tax=Pseudorca crassidens TaxID=82174 RepID=UPI00352F6947
MGRPRALLISASSRRPSRPPPSAHARSPPARRPRRSGFPNQRPGSAPPPGGGGGRVVLAAAPAAAEPAESQRLTCARCGGPTDRLATGLTDAKIAGKSEPWATLGIRELASSFHRINLFLEIKCNIKGKQTTLHYWKPFLLILLHFKIYGLI